MIEMGETEKKVIDIGEDSDRNGKDEEECDKNRRKE